MATYKVFRFNVGMSFVFCFPFFYSENILERYLLIGSPAGYQFRAICIIDGGHEGGFKDVEMSMRRHHVRSREDLRNFMDVVQNIVILQHTTTDGRLSKQT